MTNEQIRNAIGYFNTSLEQLDTLETPHPFISSYWVENIKVLIVLAQSVLSVGELKEKECCCETQSVYDTRITHKNAKCNNCNYNQALHDFRLWLVNKLMGVEEVFEKQRYNDDVGHDVLLGNSQIKRLSKAVKETLGVKE